MSILITPSDTNFIIVISFILFEISKYFFLESCPTYNIPLFSLFATKNPPFLSVSSSDWQSFYELQFYAFTSENTKKSWSLNHVIIDLNHSVLESNLTSSDDVLMDDLISVLGYSFLYIYLFTSPIWDPNLIYTSCFDNALPNYYLFYPNWVISLTYSFFSCYITLHADLYLSYCSLYYYFTFLHLICQQLFHTSTFAS